MKIEPKLLKFWYGPSSFLTWMLRPLAFLYGQITWIRRIYLQRFKQWHADIPVVVVGNLTVGGVGKTPLVAAIARHYTAKGWRVGIVSRGYGAKLNHYPYQVSPNDCALTVGDEPLLLAKLTHCPVMIDPNRVRAVQTLMQTHVLDLILSDDGLQHYALGRQVEIVVMDGERGLGNHCLLPAGPLRESSLRIKDTDLVVIHGHLQQCTLNKVIEKLEKKYTMHLQPLEFKEIKSGQTVSLDTFKDENMHAIAGIGHPERFFSLLSSFVKSLQTHVFPDHHAFKLQDLNGLEGGILMTDKDAVKCVSFAKDRWYSLSVEAHLREEFWVALTALIKGKKRA